MAKPISKNGKSIELIEELVFGDDFRCVFDHADPQFINKVKECINSKKGSIPSSGNYTTTITTFVNVIEALREENEIPKGYHSFHLGKGIENTYNVLHIHLPEKNPDGTVVDYFERNKGAYHQIKVAYDRKTDIIKKENMQDK